MKRSISTLVWRVLNTPDTSYRVFTHLLNADGIVIAQHDGFPVSRHPADTGWVRDEYMIDPYALDFLPEGKDYRGPARLEIGFYAPIRVNGFASLAGPIISFCR